MKIRRKWFNDEWFYSIADVVGVLSESSNPRKYWNKLKERLKKEGSEMVTNCHQLKILSSDGKYYLTDCGNVKTIFMILPFCGFNQ